MVPSASPPSPISRRRVLSLTTAAAVSALTPHERRLTAQSTPVATSATTPPAASTPVAGTPTAEALPLPSTLAADASPAFRAVAETLVAAMRQYQVPGAALGILAGDREEHATFGVESVASLAPVTPQTLFGIGSVTKTFTATAIWRLIDEGALALDAPVRTYLPDFRLMDEQAAAEVTVDQLLTHSTGWYGDDFTDTGSDDGALARYITEVLPRQLQLFPPDAHFSYNNAGFDVLGRLSRSSPARRTTRPCSTCCWGRWAWATRCWRMTRYWRAPMPMGTMLPPSTASRRSPS